MMKKKNYRRWTTEEVVKGCKLIAEHGLFDGELKDFKKNENWIDAVREILTSEATDGSIVMFGHHMWRMIKLRGFANGKKGTASSENLKEGFLWFMRKSIDKAVQEGKNV